MCLITDEHGNALPELARSPAMGKSSSRLKVPSPRRDAAARRDVASAPASPRRARRAPKREDANARVEFRPRAVSRDAREHRRAKSEEARERDVPRRERERERERERAGTLFQDFDALGIERRDDSSESSRADEGERRAKPRVGYASVAPMKEILQTRGCSALEALGILFRDSDREFERAAATTTPSSDDYSRRLSSRDAL